MPAAALPIWGLHRSLVLHKYTLSHLQFHALEPFYLCAWWLLRELILILIRRVRDRERLSGRWREFDDSRLPAAGESVRAAEREGGVHTPETYRSLSRVTGCGCDSSAGSPSARGECVCVWSPFAWMLTLMKASKVTGFKRLGPAGNAAVARHGSQSHRIAVLVTLDNILSCNHTTRLINDRGSHITRSVTRRTPRWARLAVNSDLIGSRSRMHADISTTSELNTSTGSKWTLLLI